MFGVIVFSELRRPTLGLDLPESPSVLRIFRPPNHLIVAIVHLLFIGVLIRMTSSDELTSVQPIAPMTRLQNCLPHKFFTGTSLLKLQPTLVRRKREVAGAVESHHSQLICEVQPVFLLAQR